jgi:hypothetical protein
MFFFLLGLDNSDVSIIEHFCYTYRYLAAKVVFIQWMVRHRKTIAGKQPDLLCPPCNHDILLQFLDSHDRDDIAMVMRNNKENNDTQLAKEILESTHFWIKIHSHHVVNNLSTIYRIVMKLVVYYLHFHYMYYKSKPQISNLLLGDMYMYGNGRLASILKLNQLIHTQKCNFEISQIFFSTEILVILLYEKDTYLTRHICTDVYMKHLNCMFFMFVAIFESCATFLK